MNSTVSIFGASLAFKNPMRLTGDGYFSRLLVVSLSATLFIVGDGLLHELCVSVPRHCLEYKESFFYFLLNSLSFCLPLWPCSAAPAICVKANREQRDARRAVAVGEERNLGGKIVGGKERITGDWKRALRHVSFSLKDELRVAKRESAGIVSRKLAA